MRRKELRKDWWFFNPEPTENNSRTKDLEGVIEPDDPMGEAKCQRMCDAEDRERDAESGYLGMYCDS